MHYGLPASEVGGKHPIPNSTLSASAVVSALRGHITDPGAGAEVALMLSSFMDLSASKPSVSMSPSDSLCKLA